MERVNVSVLREIAKGREVIAAAGSLEAYDRAARSAGRKNVEVDTVRCT